VTQAKLNSVKTQNVAHCCCCALADLDFCETNDMFFFGKYFEGVLRQKVVSKLEKMPQT